MLSSKKQFVVNVPETDYYRLDFRWFTRENNARRVRVNSGAARVVNFEAETPNAWEYQPFVTRLNAGENTIRIWFHQEDAGANG